MPDPKTQLVLASTSPYRRELLARLGIPFDVVAPPFPEDLSGLPPAQHALFSAWYKAKSVADAGQEGVIIGSDQVLALEGREILGKPGSREGAVEQLMRMAGREHAFYTGLACFCTDRREFFLDVVPVQVRLKHLTVAQIEAYVTREMPVDCAGSFKIESLGIALMERVRSDDPTALIGLPLISLSRMLCSFGYDPLVYNAT